MKQRMQGMFLGMLMTVLALGAVSVVAASGRTIDVVYGVAIVVEGEAVDFPEGARPFVSEGQVFAPVDVLAGALGFDFSWNEGTHTVYLDAQVPQVLLPFFENVPFFERGGRRGSQLALGTVSMQGTPFPNSLRINFPRTGIGQWDAWKHFNLNGEFELLTGIIGRVDGSGTGANFISFIGDGRTLATFSIDGDTSPMDIAVDVRGVRVLRIQFDESIRNAQIAFTDAMIG